MYVNKNAKRTAGRWQDPAAKEERQKKDRLRQQYYAKLEKEKQALAESPKTVDAVETDELQNGDVVLKKDTKVGKKKPARKPIPEPKTLPSLKRKKG